jgi:hypothetical protein
MAGNKCLYCKEVYKKQRDNQSVCSSVCAMKYTIQQREKKAAQTKQKEKKAWKEEKKKLLPFVYSKKYKNNLQSQINLLARKIDSYFGYLCIDCGKPYGQQTDGAHFHNVQGNENIRFNLHNIHSARSNCNKWDSEHKIGYRKGIEKRYGKKYLNFIDVEISKKYPYLGLNELEISEKLTIARKLNRDFDKVTTLRGNNGIQMRDYYNNLLKIYS